MKELKKLVRIDIPFVVEKQHITQPTREKLVAGGRNYFYATFTVCEKWSDITDIKATFVRGDISKLVELSETETGYECQIPWEVMADKGVFQVGIFGGNRLLTNLEYVVVLDGCYVGDKPLPPSEDWFDKIEKEISNKVDKAEGKGLSSNDYTDTDKASLARLNQHAGDKTNPHNVTKAQIGLDKVDNTPDAEKRVAYARDAGWAESALRAGSANNADSAMSDWNGNNIVDTYATKAEVSTALGDISTALDSIIALQNSYIGGTRA